jgi:hypothetical protein
MDFIEDMKKVFPTLQDDWGIYVPEVKYLSPEPLVNYRNLSLTKFPNVHFVGDALSLEVLLFQELRQYTLPRTFFLITFAIPNIRNLLAIT